MIIITLDWSPFKIISWERLLWGTVEITCYIGIIGIIIIIILLIILAKKLK